ncbi:2'-5' RNA ligase [Geomicrobium halophilum]|uniref:RNA 2',3'-cyclic phosphodiesterase n=1 Tax=Geomicrobium halophilum TaxID=549000 RepID=A0A841PKC1_9BACL|nr:2'-5' RNA ligase [Geomicrobium halophilum]
MSNDNPHYFLALPVPASVQKQLNELTAFTEIQKFQSITHVNDYHLTLFFLGGVDHSSLSRLQEKISATVSRFSSFDVQLNSASVFGDQKRPRVLFADVKKNHPLNQLHAAIMEECVDVGFKREKLPFRPHITIAKRWKSEEDFPFMNIARETDDWQDICWRVEEVGLYAVRLGQLPRYQCIDHFLLRGA